MTTPTTTTPKRPGLKVGSRTEFTIFANVLPGHETALRETLERNMANPRTQQAVQDIGTLHESRWVLFDNGRRVMFCSSFDGSWDKYIDDFATTIIGQSFDQSWRHTEGFPGIHDPHIKDWFMAHAVEAANFVCAYPPPSVKEVWRALAVENAFEQVLDSPGAADALAAPVLKPLLDLAST
jgi:hypothetical protein